MSYRVFKRTWWKDNPSWPNGLEPCAGRRTYISRVFKTEGDARIFCQQANRELSLTATARQRRLSLKYEYEGE